MTVNGIQHRRAPGSRRQPPRAGFASTSSRGTPPNLTAALTSGGPRLLLQQGARTAVATAAAGLYASDAATAEQQAMCVSCSQPTRIEPALCAHLEARALLTPRSRPTSPSVGLDQPVAPRSPLNRRFESLSSLLSLSLSLLSPCTGVRSSRACATCRISNGRCPPLPAQCSRRARSKQRST